MSLPRQRSLLAGNWLQQGWRLFRSWPWRLLGVLIGLALLLALVLLGYQTSARTATLDLDGTTLTLRTHRRLVGGVLQQAGLSLGPGDQVSPPLQAFWQPGQEIVIQRALPVSVLADGRERRFYGQPRSLIEILVHSGVSLEPGDVVYVNSERIEEGSYTDERELRRLLSSPPAAGQLQAPLPPRPALHIEVQRAVPLHIHDGFLTLQVRVPAATVGEALDQAGFHLYQADRVRPALDTPLSEDMHIHIAHAMPVQIQVDGRSYTTRTWSGTVAGLLQEESIVLQAMDRVEPALESPLRPGLAIRVVRVSTLEVTEGTTLPYVKRQEADPSMELDQSYLRPGEEGLKESVTLVTYEDGREVRRAFMGERVSKEPVDEVFYYGTKIVIRTLETPHGTLEYWRRLHVLATHYYPSTCDKEPGHPLYGITYTGKRATRGIIAIDPRIIPFHTKMYVPGYGPGVAEDIGGAIKGLHIDVCFDDADEGKGLWDTRYLDIYLLTPVPPSGSFPWILPGR